MPKRRGSRGRSRYQKNFRTPRGRGVRTRTSSGQTLRLVVQAAPAFAPSLPAAYRPDGVLVGPNDPRPRKSRF